jgi:hypothetical protein
MTAPARPRCRACRAPLDDDALLWDSAECSKCALKRIRGER